MIDQREAEKLIKDHLDIQRLKRIIRNTSIVAWQKEISDEKIDKWLCNFNGNYFEDEENEKRLALWLLAHFSYYTLNDIRVLCRNLFNQYLHEKLRERGNNELSQTINSILNDTIFVGLGNDSESGNNILYYFRQENSLPKKSFEIDLDRTYENLVYIDDVTISGEQAIEYINSRNIKAGNTYAALLIATEDAVKRLTEAPEKIRVISTIQLDERDRAFSDLSYVFSEKRIGALKETAEDFCKYYGARAVKDCGYMSNYPLGFGNGQYMIGFEYNTPDNTLPIFWADTNGWIPLFKRYPKIYKEEAYILDERKYY